MFHLYRVGTDQKRETKETAMRYITTLFKPKQKADVPHSSGIYDAQWVNKLAAGIERNSELGVLYVVCDPPSSEDKMTMAVDTFNFEYPDRDWSSMMEMFNPDVVGDGAIMLGLDTIITGSLERIEDACKGHSCIVPIDPYHAPLICNAAVYVDAEVAAEIWEKWQIGRWAYMQEDKYKMFGKFSEMRWLREHLKYDGTWDALVPGAIQSYRVNLNRGPPKEDTAMVYFHGSPKLHQVGQPWVKEHWK